MKEISLQLYSIRDAITELGFEKVLDEVAKMGYTGVEFAGRGDVSAKDMKKYLDNAGLKAVSSHTGYAILKDELDAEMEYMGYLGAKYITCPSAPMGTLSQVEETAEVLNIVGKKMKENGFTLSYHNHAPELWLTVNGKRSLDYLYEITDPEGPAGRVPRAPRRCRPLRICEAVCTQNAHHPLKTNAVLRVERRCTGRGRRYRFPENY